MEDITDVDDFSLLDQRPAEPFYLSESMFTRICHQFTFDAGIKTLIPSPSLHEAKHLLPLNVVTMKKRGNIKEYSTYDIPLSNLLIGQPVPGLRVVESKYCSHNSDNTCSLNWNIRGHMNHIMEGGFGNSSDITITCNLGDLLERTIGYATFMSAIKDRKLDMNHHLIREIKDAKHVLCVIRGVITTTDKVEMACTDKTGGNMHLLSELNITIEGNADINKQFSSARSMIIEPGTTMAYDVWELKVDVDSGEITPIMMANNSGGFFKGDIRKREKLHCIKEIQKKPNEGDPAYDEIKNKEIREAVYRLYNANDQRRQLAASELQVTRLHLEEQRTQNNELERRFDSELSKVQEEMKTEKSVRERLQREKDELLHDATDLRSQLAASEEKATILAAELQVTKERVEERRTQNNKLQRRFDSELSKVQKKIRTGKSVREKHQKLERKTLIREKDKTIQQYPGHSTGQNIKQMFPEICLEVVNAVGGNTLIPSPSSDASMHLLPLNVVTMRNKRKMVHFYTKEYSTYDFSLTDLLIDKPVLIPKGIEHKVLSYSQKSTSTWCGMFGRLIRNVIGLSVNVSDEPSITNKYGQLLLQEIGDATFISALEERKLNMEHHFIQQIDKTQTVLCVVKGVLTASGEVRVKETRKADMNIKATEKSSDTKHAHCGADASTEREMVLNPGTTLAYKVWELEVNVDNGHIIPVMTEDYSGGFIKNTMKSVQSDEPFRLDILPDSSGRFSHLGAVKLVLSDGQFRFELLPESSGDLPNIFGMFILSNQPFRLELLPESSGGCSHINAMKSVQSDEQFRFESLPGTSRGISPIFAMKSVQSDEQFRFKLLPESIGGISPIFAKKSVQSDQQVTYGISPTFRRGFPSNIVMKSVQSDEEFRFELLSESSGEYSKIFAMMWMRSNELFGFKLLPEFSGGFSHLNAMKSVQSDEQFRFELLPESSGEFSKIFAMKSVQSDEQVRFGLLPQYRGEFSHLKDMMMALADQQFRYKLLPESSGGCSHINVEDNVAELLKDFKNILQPLHDCAKAEDEHIKYSLLVLMTCSSDVLALSKILSKAEDGCLNEDKDTLDKQFINNDTVWSILTDVGVQTGDGRVLCEGKATPILTAVSYMIDAILELENDFLNIIYDCDEQQLKTLLKIFESAVASSTTISVDVDISSVLKEPVSSFLTRLKFTVCNDSIQPPTTKTCIVECIFCVLYCLL